MNENNANPVLHAENVHKTFASGDRRITVLRGASLSVAPGESVSIRGESGSGKSTLLNLFAGLDAPDTGTILWGGRAEMPVSRANYLGIIFQSFYLIPELDALANVLIAARILGRVGPAEKQRATDLLARVGLAERMTHLPTQLSGGERQRVALARALLNNPVLILADEPTGNLDERTGDAVVDLLLDLYTETRSALVLVTHNPAHAAKCARQLTLHEGVLR